MEVTIREMTQQDCAGKGYVQYRSWEETYRGLLPDQYLEDRTLAWCIQAAETYPIPTLVAEDGGSVVGFVCYFKKARDFVRRRDASEIAALYVLKGWQGRGIGSRLLACALSRLPQGQVSLFVLEGNAHAIAFYQRKGFRHTQRSLTEETGHGLITEWEMLLEWNGSSA